MFPIRFVREDNRYISGCHLICLLLEIGTHGQRGTNAVPSYECPDLERKLRQLKL
jgi:hypothetical protein